MSENMRDQDESRDETGAVTPGGVEYIGSEPIKGPLIGSESAAGSPTPAPPESPAQEPAAEDEEARPSEGEELNWYVVHCYSGYENKVKHNLEQRVEAMGVANLIDEVVVPTEEEMEVRDGKRRTIEKRVFPGYILVHMKLDERALNVVRATPGVTRFVGMGSRPTPLTPQEVNQIMHRMQAEAPKLRVNFRTGQKVRITDGPFADFMGLVDKIDTERAKVTVLVSFFGRETPVELDFLQVERM
jgi:transcription termination/antitermination protein NusG